MTTVNNSDTPVSLQAYWQPNTGTVFNYAYNQATSVPYTQPIWFDIVAPASGILQFIYIESLYGGKATYMDGPNRNNYRYRAGYVGTINIRITNPTTAGATDDGPLLYNNTLPLLEMGSLATTPGISIIDKYGNYTVRFVQNQVYRIHISITTDPYTSLNITLSNVPCSNTYISNIGQIYDAQTELNGAVSGAASGCYYPFVVFGLALDGGWSDYQNWKLVDAKTQKYERIRYCNNPTPAPGALNCDGWINPIFYNNTGATYDPSLPTVVPEQLSKSTILSDGSMLPVEDATNYDSKWGPTQMTFYDRETPATDGGWSDWSGWSECDAGCGDGVQTRTRVCNNPYVTFGGKDCVGSVLDTQPCNAGSCTVAPVVHKPVIVNIPDQTPVQLYTAANGGTFALIPDTEDQATSAALVPAVTQKNDISIYLLVLIAIVVVALSLSYWKIGDEPAIYSSEV